MQFHLFSQHSASSYSLVGTFDADNAWHTPFCTTGKELSEQAAHENWLGKFVTEGELENKFCARCCHYTTISSYTHTLTATTSKKGSAGKNGLMTLALQANKGLSMPLVKNETHILWTGGAQPSCTMQRHQNQMRTAITDIISQFGKSLKNTTVAFNDAINLGTHRLP